ncbi:MurR/RpiR family transcriptional regulator [Paenibacillaceae bacterium WGS1546]|uniref:MurR/RpiR family transcriptional regulator n=1 Tax=Cohnella sp. WGS1546 TaxID=3366810 RepID=UPI00372CEDB3
MNGGLVRLREILDRITPSERKVAEFILKDPRSTVGLSIAQLAERSGGSQAAVTRLCKSLGLKGYKELMLKVAGDLHESGGQGYFDIRPQDSISNIVRNVSNNNMQAIRDTMKLLDVAMVNKAVEALARAEHIYFYGVGASNLIAQDAQHKFVRINKTSFAFADTDLQRTTAVLLTERDVAVGISYSGQTANVVACLKSAKKAGATIISITKYGQTPVSDQAHIPLFISSTENKVRIGAMSSRITQLNLIDILYTGLASIDYEKSVKYLEISQGALDEEKGK